MANAEHNRKARAGYAGVTRHAPLMLLLAGFLSLPLIALSATDTAARPPAPWCAYLSGDWGIDCSYHTFEQCREFISGVGGHCSANPYVVLVEERRGYGTRRASKRYR